MEAMALQDHQVTYDSKLPESRHIISLGNSFSAIEMDFSACPNILIEIEEFHDAVGITSPLQAGLLVNQDHSLWLTNLGRNGSTEVYRPENGRHRKLAFNQVGYVRHGDCIGFYGSFFRVLFGFSTVQLKPLSEQEIQKIKTQLLAS